MDAHNISRDDDESDTSQEDLDEGEVRVEVEVNCSVDAAGASDPDELGSVKRGRMDDLFGNLAKSSSWMRKPVDPADPLILDSSSNSGGYSSEEHRESIQFFLIDTDFGLVSNLDIEPNLLAILPPPLNSPRGKQSIINLHGITENGNSICCNVFGFLPYFYVVPSIPIKEILQFQEGLSDALRDHLLSELRFGPVHSLVEAQPPIVEVELMKKNHPVFDYHQSPRKKDGGHVDPQILKVICLLPRFVWAAGELLKSWEWSPPDGTSFTVYESSINHNVRFLTDRNWPGCCLLKIEKGYFSFRTGGSKLSVAQIELNTHFESIDLVSSKELPPIPPIRILSFDIEVLVHPPKYNFPRNGNEQVLQIGNTLFVYGESEEQEKKVIFVLGSCAEIPGATVISFKEEKELLESWSQFLLSVDPDMITGYNIKKFDLPYLLNRAERIGATKFPYFGRVKSRAARVRPTKNELKKMNEYDENGFRISGRVILDLFPLMGRHNTIPGSLKLADVSKRYLKSQDTKKDVKYWEIFQLQNGNSGTRARLASYCVHDSFLPIQILLEVRPFVSKNPGMDLLNYYISKSFSSGNALRYLLTKSRAYNTYFKLVRSHKNPVGLSGLDTPSRINKRSELLIRKPSTPCPSTTESTDVGTSAAAQAQMMKPKKHKRKLFF